MGLGLDQASSFLMAMGQNANQPSMAGFNVPPQVLNTDAWGLGDAEISARALIKDGRGSMRELSFSGRSRLSKRARARQRREISRRRSC